ncbi:hypothetical protein M514_24261 [Trichuris suis]|uniref:Uncharacterized protein n=1 Tax=Trichuris suis TaxID=68888 RepID=A0A085N252_9BILA|nr:hypothetical protein M514_24261 [Trichuris suis]
MSSTYLETTDFTGTSETVEKTPSLNWTYKCVCQCGRVAQRITRRSTEPKIAGSNPAAVGFTAEANYKVPILCLLSLDLEISQHLETYRSNFFLTVIKAAYLSDPQ